MTFRWRTVVLLCGVCLAHVVRAQTLDSNDRPFMSAASLVLALDLLSARCLEQTQFTPDGASKIAAWVSENEVERIRTRTRELEQDAAQKRQFAMVRRMFSLPFSARGQAACKSAVDASQREDAQFSRTAPQMIAALRARGGAVAAAPPPARSPARDSVLPARRAPDIAPPGAGASGAPAASGAADALAERIVSFGFDSRAAMGAGGFMMLNIYPVVLFRDGSALTDVEGLGFQAGLDAHRATHPSDWTRWRRQSGEYQLESKGKWEKLQYQTTYSTLPAGFHLNGRFSRTSGTGNIAMGGTASVIVESAYAFTTDGHVIRGGFAGSMSRSSDVSVITRSVAANRRGQYTIDGITLRINYDDGSRVQFIIVTDPADPSVIWLDGASYVREQ